MMAGKFLRRLSAWRLDKANGWIAGVCAGLARAVRLAPATVRVAFIAVALFAPTFAVAVYLIAWVALHGVCDHNTQ